MNISQTHIRKVTFILVTGRWYPVDSALRVFSEGPDTYIEWVSPDGDHYVVSAAAVTGYQWAL